VEGEEMFAEPMVDVEGSEFDKELAGKVERGIVNAASIGITILEVSTDASLLKEGQTFPTVTKCLLREISLCDIPSNKNAVRLFDREGTEIQLSENGEGMPMPKINNKQETFSEMDKEILKSVGLSDNATLAEAVAVLQHSKIEMAKLKAENDTLRNAQKSAQKVEAEAMLSEAVTDGRLDATTRESWANLFDKDFDAAKTALGTMKKAAKMTDFAKPGQSSLKDGKYNGKTYKEMMRQDEKGLANLKANDIETFKELYKAQYGTDYKE
jgi:hypothetical protein